MLGQQKTLWLPVGLLLGMVVYICCMILKVNHGVFPYAVDDAYIHLSLAYNLTHHAHHSSSLSGFSAPSSSLLWPFLLTPFAMLPKTLFTYIPLLVNIFASMALLVSFSHFWTKQINPDAQRKQLPVLHSNHLAFLLCCCALISITNLPIMIYCGMEHVPHILFNFLIAWGCIQLHSKKSLPHWAIAAAILAPLFRFESLAMSSSMILLLLHQKRYQTAGIICALISIPILIFFGFIHFNNADLWLPSSILAKKLVIRRALYVPLTVKIFKAPFLFISGLLGLHCLIFKPSTRFLSSILLLVILAQFAFGLNDYFRYLPSFYAFYYPLILYCYRSNLQTPPKHLLRYYLTCIAIGTCLYTYLALPYYARSPQEVVLAAHQLYGQQFQMHRFVQHFYPKPALVNDIGWVSYLNPQPVYDINGLSQPNLIRLQYLSMTEKGRFLKEFVRKNKIPLAMLYPGMPTAPHWHHIATLHTSGTLITISLAEVFFYSTSPQFDSAIRQALQKFKATLPNNVHLNIFKTTPAKPMA